jgi:hypothetical protein
MVNLVKIVEHTKVSRKDGKLMHTAEDGHEVLIVPEDAPCKYESLWISYRAFLIFSTENAGEFFRSIYLEMKRREFFLPSVVMQVIKENAGTITAISTTSQWFGMTYPEDRAGSKKQNTNIDRLRSSTYNFDYGSRTTFSHWCKMTHQKQRLIVSLC